MTMQLKDVCSNYAGGGEWITWANAIYCDPETQQQTVNVTIAIGCGYINVYPGHITWDDLCGDNRFDPQISYRLRDLEWCWDENGEITNSFGDKYLADFLPDEPYCFDSDDLCAVSEACEALWHYHKFVVLSR